MYTVSVTADLERTRAGAADELRELLREGCKVSTQLSGQCVLGLLRQVQVVSLQPFRGQAAVIEQLVELLSGQPIPFVQLQCAFDELSQFLAVGT